MSASSSTKPFDFDAQYGKGYDSMIRAVFPGYESFFQSAAGILSLSVPKEGRVLVCGCGTGSELLAFSKLQPQWQLTGVDPSATMIELCRHRLGNHPGLHLHEGYLDSLDTGLPFDGATSVLVMHFLKDDGSKLAYLKQVRKLLKPNAGYIHLDVMEWPETKTWQALLQGWEKTALSVGLEKERFDSLVAQIRQALYGVSEARMEELFTQAGFADIQKFWMCFHHTGWMMRAG